MHALKFTVVFLALAALLASVPARAADAVFSGPQKGEKTTPFKVLDLTLGSEPRERNPIAENAGSPAAIVFVHGLERSLLPLLRVVDQYGAERKDKINTEVVFLFADRLEGEQRLKAALNSIRLKSRAGLSLDGAEGPGNYGLNKECMMTIIAASNNVVVANFALVQPGIADAPAVVAALARACGDSNPPPIEQLSASRMAREGMARDGEARRERPRGENARNTAATPNLVPERFPGAVPTDPKLNSLMRQMIRKETDDATVDRLRAEMETTVKNNPELARQAIDGWTRVLHFGDRYGTEYARKRGREMMEALQRAEKKN